MMKVGFNKVYYEFKKKKIGFEGGLGTQRIMIEAIRYNLRTWFEKSLIFIIVTEQLSGGEMN